MTTQLAQLSALVGFLLPVGIAFLQHQSWSKELRTVIALIAIAAASLITVWADPNAGFTWHNWATSVIAVFVMAKSSYATMWRSVQVDKLNRKT